MSAQPTLFGETSGATLDPSRCYRYDLWRTWDPNGPRCAWVMLNPSTADETEADPTIRRCIGYARAWGFGGVVVRNLFALRATDPAALFASTDPVGPDADRWLSDNLDGVGRVVVAWGTGRCPRLGDRWRRAAGLLAPRRPLCLRVAKDGQPVHPLYQRGDLTPVAWQPPEEG